jgi:hypothetical protein
MKSLKALLAYGKGKEQRDKSEGPSQLLNEAKQSGLFLAPSAASEKTPTSHAGVSLTYLIRLLELCAIDQGASTETCVIQCFKTMTNKAKKCRRVTTESSSASEREETNVDVVGESFTINNQMEQTMSSAALNHIHMPDYPQAVGPGSPTVHWRSQLLCRSCMVSTLPYHAGHPHPQPVCH